MNILAQDILAPEHFSTWIFWHLAKQYGRFGTDILAPVLLCRNVHVLKCPRAEMFLCRKFLVPKSPCARKSPCWNVPVLKCPSAGTSAAWNGACAKMFLWWNISAEMPRFSVSKWSISSKPTLRNLICLSDLSCTGRKIITLVTKSNLFVKFLFSIYLTTI